MPHRLVVLLFVWVIAGSLLRAQDEPAPRANQPPAIKNPREGDPEAIRAGASLYSSKCASCHGGDAKGSATGGDLTRLWGNGGADPQIFQIVRRGIANTLKPHSFGPDNDIWPVLAYLRTLDKSPPGTKVPGDAGKGEQVFRNLCSRCHQVNGNGGVLGPDLSQIASARSRALLAHKIRHASSYIMDVYAGGYVMESYQPVTLVTREGQRIRAVKKNEDTFTIQIMDSSERLQGYLKSSLREVVNDEVSLMPDFDPEKLLEHDLNDLLAYLGTLRPPNSKRP